MEITVGTRNLTIIRLNGEVKIAQYCQWDGYPAGQGATIAKFLQKDLDLPKFKKAVAALTWISEDELKELWRDCGATNDGWASLEVSKNFLMKYPELHRDTGAGVLKLVQDGKVFSLQNDYEFRKDTLSCEYVYDIDLDNETVTLMGHPTKPSIKLSFKEFTVEKMDALDREIS